MLFDLKGRRRRVVQVTYVGLAVLMGGGLVLSGIGSDASGGLLDAFIGGSGDTSDKDAKKPFEEQIKAADAKLASSPNDPTALAALVRARFSLAGFGQQEQNGVAVGYNDEGKAQLRQADEAWTRYLDTNPDRIDPGLAATALQIYDPLGLGTPTDAKKIVIPARAIAEEQDTADAYIKLIEVATLAGDTRTAALAERKALSFAQSKEERATLKERITTAKAAAASAGTASPSAP